VAGWGLLGRWLDMATHVRRPGRAALAEPLAVGLHALVVGGGVRGKRVLISGSGPIGTVQVGVEDLPDSDFDVSLECAGAPQALHGLLPATRRTGVLVRSAMCPTRLDRSTWRVARSG
jgi:L-idonate 5-dehydrogenase